MTRTGIWVAAALTVAALGFSAAALGQAPAADAWPQPNPETLAPGIQKDTILYGRKLFNETYKEFANRSGGYTRIYKLGQQRISDAAELALIEFVKADDAGYKKSKGKKAKGKKAAKPAAAAAEAPKAEGEAKS